MTTTDPTQRNALRVLPRRPLPAPSILSADFGQMASSCATVLDTSVGGTAKHGATVLHLDVMDGHFVPNLTMGVDMLKGLRRAFPLVTLDAHLMVTDPQDYIDAYAAAGLDHFTFHLEPSLGIYRSKGPVEGPARYNPADLLSRIHSHAMTAGIAINPPTDPDALTPYLDGLDMALVMSVNPGFSGQAFIDSSLDTVASLRKKLRPDQWVQVDGGVTPANAARVRDAGADILVAASAVFGVDPAARPGVLSQLRGPLS